MGFGNINNPPGTFPGGVSGVSGLSFDPGNPSTWSGSYSSYDGFSRSIVNNAGVDTTTFVAILTLPTFSIGGDGAYYPDLLGANDGTNYLGAWSVSMIGALSPVVSGPVPTCIGNGNSIGWLDRRYGSNRIKRSSCKW